NKMFKWAVLYPGFRKFVNWVYAGVLKMPQYHIGMAPGQIGRYLLLMDDPQDAEKAAALLDGAQAVAWHREYRTFTGMLEGTRVSVTSVGLGGPSAAIGVHELSAIGGEVFLYLGCGLTAAKGIYPGEMLIAKGAVRDEGTGLQYAPPAFPAIADLRLVDCLRRACVESSLACHVGLTRSTDAYYQINADQAGSFPYTLCSDLNSAAIFIVSSVLGRRASSLLQAGKRIQPLTMTHIKTGISALRQLIAIDGL
ncbi:phosphorylase family protein, partial [Candidatus Darwinibacter acetoxidans]